MGIFLPVNFKEKLEGNTFFVDFSLIQYADNYFEDNYICEFQILP